MSFKSLILLSIALSTGSFVLAVSPEGKKMENRKTLFFKTDKVIKDLKDSIQGVDAESFEIGRKPSGVNLKVLLNEQRNSFKNFLNDVGYPLLRMMDISRYSWRGVEATDALRGYKGSERWWYSPQELHEFCRANNIKLMGFFDVCKLYDFKTGKVTVFYEKKSKKYDFKITAEQIDALVEENLYKLRWVKEHGYLDLYEGWEIGSENYNSLRNSPEIYVNFVKKMTKAAKRIDPNIRLAVNIFVCAADDDNLLDKANINPRKITGKGEQDIYDKFLAWSRIVLSSLGDTAKDIYYVCIHLYGPSLRHNANAKGINTFVKVAHSYPNMQHTRFIVTEWRHSGSGELTKHRQFKTAALWKAKFSMVMLAHPLIDSTGVHDFLTYSGVGYWSDGKVWRSQWKSLKPFQAYSSRSAKKHIDIGPFGPILKMLNTIVRKYPLLLQHKAGLGKYSSAYFYEKCVPNAKNKDDGRDIEWIIATNRKKDKFGGIVVNTHEYPIQISLRSNNKTHNIIKARSESCPTDKLFICEVPGEAKYWRLGNIKINSDGSIDLPPLSVTLFEAD